MAGGAIVDALLAGFQTSVLWLCVVLVLAFAGVAIVVNLRRQMKAVRRRLKGSAAVVMAAVAVVCTVMARKGTVVVSDPYIKDSGSYLTNDVAHVAIAKRSQLLPDDTEILVYARQVDLTNATDWVRLEPHLTLAQHLLVEGVYYHDYTLVNATNFDVIVAANFTPEQTIHTNGVLQIKGFMIPGTGKAAFPNTRIRKETP